MIVPIVELEEPKPVLDKSLIEVEDENRGSWSVICNHCNKTAWMCKWIRSVKTRKCALLEEQYHPQTGQIAKKHECMKGGTSHGQFYSDGKVQVELKKIWCNFCDHFYDLSHWCIFNNKVKSMRPQLMCIQEVKICNHSEYYDPLTNGWFRS